MPKLNKYEKEMFTMKKNLRKITTMAATFLLFFSFSQSVGPGYYEALDACKEAGKNAAKNITVNIDWSKYIK